MSIALEERKKFPTEGCRRIYEEAGKSLPIGRDKTIKVLFSEGFRVRYKKRYKSSTEAGTRPFKNHLHDKNVDWINQVWQADMAYYLRGTRPLYTIYITDVYSQEIVGYGAFNNSRAESFSTVLKGAIKRAKQRGESLSGLIHHSDGGKQYESKLYQDICKENEITQSMCMFSYENPYAEKTNDIINNGYLNVWCPTTLEKLRIAQKRAVENHNNRQKKKALGKLSPVSFRKLLNQKNEIDNHYVLKLKPRNPEKVKTRPIKKW